MKIASLVGYPFVKFGNFNPLPLPILRTFDHSGKSSLRPGKSLFGLPQMLGVFNLFARAEYSKILDTQVYPNSVTRTGWFVNLDLALNSDIVLTALGLRDGAVFHLAFNGSVDDRLDPAHFGKIDQIAIYLEALRVSDRLSGFLGFELGVFSSTFKKVDIASVKVFKFLLQDLTISLLEPFSFRVRLERFKAISQLVVGQPFTVGLIVFFPAGQAPIVHIPSVSKLDSQRLLLFGIRFETILKRLFDLQCTFSPLLKRLCQRLIQTCYVSRDLAIASLARGTLFAIDWPYSLLFALRSWLCQFGGSHPTTGVHGRALLPLRSIYSHIRLASPKPVLSTVQLPHSLKPYGDTLGKK